MSDRPHRPDALEQVLIDEGRLPAPRRAFSLEDIEAGWEVLGNREEWVGSVQVVEEECIVVHRGILWSRLYVPLSAVGQVREGAVVLNVPANWIPSLDWQHPPRFQHEVTGQHRPNH